MGFGESLYRGDWALNHMRSNRTPIGDRKTFKVLDLFAGAGGFSLGFERFVADGFHPFEIVGAVDFDERATQTIISAMQRDGIARRVAKERVICGDITDPSTKGHLYAMCPTADVIIGGPPCQSFSTIGPRSGCPEKQRRFANDHRDNLFEHYLEIVAHYKPLLFVFENVVGITSKKDGEGRKFIDLIIERFEGLGYSLESENGALATKYLILNAADYGVPQLRNRVFIIGNRHGLPNPYPKPTHSPPESAVQQGLLPYVTVRDAIGDLPKVVAKITVTHPKKSIPLAEIPQDRIDRIKKANLSRDNGLDPAPYHWRRFNDAYRRGNPARAQFLDFIRPRYPDILLTGHVARGQQETDIELFRGMEPGTSSRSLIDSQEPEKQKLASLIKYKMDSFKDKYKKLSWEVPCSTIFAHLQKDGNRFIHPDGSQARTLTVREAARIQSFPDDYVFEAVGLVRFRYIGNAVPPLLSMSIAGSLFNWITKASKDVVLYDRKHHDFEVYPSPALGVVAGPR